MAPRSTAKYIKKLSDRLKDRFTVGSSEQNSKPEREKLLTITDALSERQSGPKVAHEELGDSVTLGATEDLNLRHSDQKASCLRIYPSRSSWSWGEMDVK